MNTISRALVLLLAIVFAYAEPVAQTEQSRSQHSVFRSGVALVTLHVTVTDRSHNYLTGLDEREFGIFEDGNRQEVKFFQKSALPLALTLLVDTSSSVNDVLPEFRRAVAQFIRRLEPHDVASIVTFGANVRVLQDFTSSHSALAATIDSTHARGETALYNGLYVALNELRKTLPNPSTNLPRRRTLLVLSDGEDTASIVGFQDVLDLAVRTDAAIYTIRLDKPPTGIRESNEGEFVLRRLAQATGGRSFFPREGYELRRVLADIREELASQYALAYESDNQRDDGRFRALSILVQRAGAVARTRPGYVRE